MFRRSVVLYGECARGQSQALCLITRMFCPWTPVQIDRYNGTPVARCLGLAAIQGVSLGCLCTFWWHRFPLSVGRAPVYRARRIERAGADDGRTDCNTAQRVQCVRLFAVGAFFVKR